MMIVNIDMMKHHPLFTFVLIKPTVSRKPIFHFEINYITDNNKNNNNNNNKR
jgi:hypothetical protein